MTPNYVAAVKSDVATAEEIIKLRVRTRENNRFYPEVYELGASVSEDGITFYDVNPAQWDDGWEIDHEIVLWEDIANSKRVIAQLKREVDAKRKRDERKAQDNKRQMLERLKKELGES